VTDADGVLDVPLPPNARSGLLTIEDAEYELHFGVLNPVNTERGVRQRLVNLGFLDQPEAPDPDLRAALEAFQAQHQLEVSGAPDEDTRQKLLDEHDRRQPAG
jgi:N-acetylmuramoyl-L-alanine amidase